MKRTLLSFFFAIFLCSCTDFEYSPHEVYDRSSPTGLNDKNLARLQQASVDDTLRFIVSGDSQVAQNNTGQFVEAVNQIAGIDLVFLAGDISEFGTLQEMEWVVRDFEKLKAPYFGVIGNHDLQGNGAEVFKKMFGDLNFSFGYGGVKFVCHDTNGREYKFNGKVPDLGWLQSEISTGGANQFFVAVGHVRPYSTDFDPALSTPYSDALNSNPNMLASFYGHDHSFGEYHPNNSRIPFIVTTSLGERGFLLVEIVNGRLSYERVNF